MAEDCFFIKTLHINFDLTLTFYNLVKVINLCDIFIAKQGDKLKVLIIDDAIDLTNTIQEILINQNYEVDCAYDGKTGLRKALVCDYDIILLDVMMPQMNGYDVLKNLRKEGRETPVIMISAKDDITDKIEGLDLGADDYLQKPFNMNELTARMRALTRRSHKTEASSNEIYYGDITIKLSSMKLFKGDLQITLSANENAIMKYLIKSSEIIVPIQKLLEICALAPDDENIISSSIERLQKILKYIGSRVKIIFIKGVGYKICC